jgi:hypothetical protein
MQQASRSLWLYLVRQSHHKCYQVNNMNLVNLAQLERSREEYELPVKK